MQYSPEFKEKVINEVQEVKSLTSVARKHSIPTSTIATWIKKSNKNVKKSIEKINNILLSLSKEISSFSNLKNPSINLKKRREFCIKELDDLTFDASRHNISIKTIELSKKLLQEMKTNQFLEAMWSGKVVNITENRQALHPALRGSRDSFLSNAFDV